MLAFFRKYQKYFFVMITIVIVISFSFFGTYSSLQRDQVVDRKAFTSIDGSEIKRQELEEFSIFLGTDSEDKLLFGGAWGPNFLNDGVIKKDFIETGLAQILVESFLSDIRTELQSRLQREKRFTPYEHPQAKFLSAVNAWNVVAPQINIQLNALKGNDDAATPEAFDARVKLFQAQRKFPHSALRYVLRHQQKQYSWISSDPNLERTDLALFGYHTIDHWFGQGFVRLVAEFIINSAQIAKEKGYEVSKTEVMADLYRNAEISFQQNAGNPNLGVATTQEYFDEQLRRMRMDKTQAVNLWQNVMLFRRLFQDLGNSVFVDPFSIEQFSAHAKETIVGDLYKLPEHLRFGDFKSLQKFELYLAAVSDSPKSGKAMLDLPKKFKPAEDVVKKYPELVQRRYLLEYGKVDKRSLQARVGVRETWSWEVQDKNWEKLKQQFPELGVKKAGTEEERHAALDSLDKKTRARVDAFARSEIVDAHPKWLEVALQEAPMERRVVGLRKKGKSDLFSGLENPEELIKLLDKYPETEKQLAKYSPDGENYYRVIVLDRSPGLEILTFAEANRDGTLDALLQKDLELKYVKVREQSSKEFKNTDGAWKPLQQVQNAVAEKAFSNILEAINNDYVSSTDEKPKKMISDYAASLRFFAFMREMRERFNKDPNAIDEWVIQETVEESNDTLPPSQALAVQWKLAKVAYQADRGTANIPIDSDQVFSLSPEEWSTVNTRANGDIAFLYLRDRYVDPDKKGLYEKVFQLHQTLSVDAQRGLMQELVDKMNAKNALSLKYLKRDEADEG